MKLRDFKIIGFDLDGTIIESLDGIYESYEHSVTKINLKVFDKILIASKIGPQIDSFFNKLYPNNKDLLNEYIYHFRSYYLNKGYKKTKLKDGMLSLLKMLYSNSHELFIVTNKSSESTNLILNELDISKYFSNTISINKKNKHLNDKSSNINFLTKNYEKSLYIGDTREDLDASISAGISFIGLEDGYGFFDKKKQTETIQFCKSAKKVIKLY
jgi:phosphoglycolate phosphatase